MAAPSFKDLDYYKMLFELIPELATDPVGDINSHMSVLLQLTLVTAIFLEATTEQVFLIVELLCMEISPKVSLLHFLERWCVAAHVEG